MKNILWIGDGVVPTGFSTVNHNIIKHLPIDKYEVHHLAVNYWGDPHNYKHKIYPASTPFLYQQGDVMGYGRIQDFVHAQIDAIFILNDIWVINNYLSVIKQVWKQAEKEDEIPPIIVYFPVDGSGYKKEWFNNFDIVTRTVVYTKFGRDVVKAVAPELVIEIIPHGAANRDYFYKFDEDTTAIKEKIYPTRPDLWEDSFIVLNANRNQPRKRLDISLLAFALFSKDKPDNVMYYHHAGIKDAGWHFVDLILRLERELDIELQKRLIMTSGELQLQAIPMEKLNEIYNATDVGLNTSLGEGWGLVNTEHAIIGKPQIVPKHSACAELFRDVGLLVPITQTVRDPQHLVKRGFVSAKNVAKRLERLYTNKTLREELGRKSLKKFTSDEYDWATVVKAWEKLFDEVLYNEE